MFIRKEDDAKLRSSFWERSNLLARVRRTRLIRWGEEKLSQSTIGIGGAWPKNLGLTSLQGWRTWKEFNVFTRKKSSFSVIQGLLLIRVIKIWLPLSTSKYLILTEKSCSSISDKSSRTTHVQHKNLLSVTTHVCSLTETDTTQSTGSQNVRFSQLCFRFCCRCKSKPIHSNCALHPGVLVYALAITQLVRNRELNKTTCLQLYEKTKTAVFYCSLTA